MYVRRGNRFRHDITEKGLQYLQVIPRPGWVIIFPEGTRFSTQKQDLIEKTRGYCKQHGIIPELNQVFAPRSKGFIMTLNGLAARLNAIYDVTIAYRDSPNTVGRQEAPDMFGN